MKKMTRTPTFRSSYMIQMDILAERMMVHVLVRLLSAGDSRSLPSISRPDSKPSRYLVTQLLRTASAEHTLQPPQIRLKDVPNLVACNYYNRVATRGFNR